MKRIFSWIGKTVEIHEVAAGYFAFFSLLTTLVGIFRERLLATMVGPGSVLDAYVIAHKIPDFLYATTAAMVSVTILLPFIAGKNTTAEKQKTFSEILTAYSIFSIALSVILIIFTPLLVPSIASGADTQTLSTAIKLCRILLLSPILMGISNICVSVAQMEKRFIATSAAPFVYNVITLFAMYILYPTLGPVGLALAIVIAAMGHMAITGCAAVQGNVRPTWTLPIQWKNIYNLLSIAIPRTFSVSMSVISSIVVIYFASHLPTGSVSLYNIAIVIQNVPIALVGVSLATSVFPDLVSAYKANSSSDFSFLITKTLRLIILAGLPCMILFLLLDSEIVAILFRGGKFTSAYIAQTAHLVRLFTFGILAQCVVQLTTRIFYARSETWKPFRQGLLGLFVTVCMLIVLTQSYKIDLNDIVLCLIAGWIVNAVVSLGTTLPYILTSDDKKTTYRFLLIVIPTALCSGFLALLTQNTIASSAIQFASVYDSQTLLSTVLSSVLVGLTFVLSYGLILFIAKIDEIQDLKTFVVGKLSR